ncbi:MAG: PKD domain-containing protein, partial [Thermoplasmata archaeon]|nr:PKD domain-containing protein [Thermoplasmata archaeon]
MSRGNHNSAPSYSANRRFWMRTRSSLILVAAITLLVALPQPGLGARPGTQASPHASSAGGLAPTWKQFSSPANVSASDAGGGYLVWDQAEHLDTYWDPNSASNHLYYFYAGNSTWRVGPEMRNMSSRLGANEWIIGAAYNWQDGVIDVTVQAQGTCAPSGYVCFFTYAHGNMTRIGSFAQGSCYGLSAWDPMDHYVWWISTGGNGDTYAIINNTVTQLSAPAPASNCNTGNAVWDPVHGYLVLALGTSYGFSTFVGGTYSAMSSPYGCNDPILAFDPDPSIDTVVSYGCYTGGVDSDEYTWGGTSWSNMGVPSATPPSTDSGSLGGFDPILGRELIVTGTYSAGADGLWSPGVGIAPGPLMVSASGSPLSGRAPLTVSLASTPSGGSGTYSTFSWHLGDGNVAATQTLVHTYSSAGTYYAWANVTDSLGSTAMSNVLVITVSPPPPLSTNASVSPRSGPLGTNFQFSSVTTGGSGTYTWSWRFGDGSFSILSAPSHAYARVGSYTARLWANDTTGASATGSVSVQVYQPIFGNWTEICSSCGPEPRGDAAMAFDPVDGYTVMFGGTPGLPTFYNDTWALSSGVWSKLQPAVSPSARQGAVMAFDPTDGYLVLFGGFDGSVLLNDTWTYSAGSWTNLHLSHSASPRYDASMVWDAKDGYLLL